MTQHSPNGQFSARANDWPFWGAGEANEANDRAAPPFAHWVHDIRNVLATAGLHLDMIARAPSETSKFAERAQASLAMAAKMCSEAMEEWSDADRYTNRRSFDVTTTITRICELVAPIVPGPTKLHVTADGPIYVMADPHDVFRILFNLIHNAITAARRRQGIRRIELDAEATASAIIVRIRDDGPGLPQAVTSRLFRRQQSDKAGGYGLAIARELAERNGGVVELMELEKGTGFTIELPAAPRTAP